MERKLNLNSLKVKSFVTDLSVEGEVTIKGGLPPSRPVKHGTDTWINCRTLYCRNTINCEYTR